MWVRTATWLSVTSMKDELASQYHVTAQSILHSLLLRAGPVVAGIAENILASRHSTEKVKSSVFPASAARVAIVVTRALSSASVQRLISLPISNKGSRLCRSIVTDVSKNPISCYIRSDC